MILWEKEVLWRYGLCFDWMWSLALGFDQLDSRCLHIMAYIADLPSLRGKALIMFFHNQHSTSRKDAKKPLYFHLCPWTAPKTKWKWSNFTSCPQCLAFLLTTPMPKTDIFLDCFMSITKCMSIRQLRSILQRLAMSGAENKIQKRRKNCLVAQCGKLARLSWSCERQYFLFFNLFEQPSFPKITWWTVSFMCLN